MSDSPSAILPPLQRSEEALPSTAGSAGRSRRLLHGTLAAMLSKGFVLVSNFVAIPIVIRTLGATNFGIWITISTALNMLLILDLGVANSLTNFISEAFAHDDRDHASRYASTALLVMVSVALALGLCSWLAWPYLDWGSIFRLASPAQVPVVSRAVAVALAIFLVGLPVGLAGKILGGYQQVRTANIFIAIGSVFNLVSIVVLVHLHAGLVALVAASAAALVGTNLLCLLWIYCFHMPWLMPHPRHLQALAARRMMKTGSQFFVLQVAGLLAFNSDNLVIMHYLGPAAVTPYSVAWRLAGYAGIVQTMMTPALWPAFSEAFARNDFVWIRRTFRRTLAVTMSTAMAFALLLAVAGRWIIRAWASKAAVPTEALMLSLCLWVLLSTYMNNTSIVLVAKGETRLQAWCSIASAVLNLALSIYLVQRVGTIGVILGTVISYAVVLVVPQTWQTYRVLKSRPAAAVGD